MQWCDLLHYSNVILPKAKILLKPSYYPRAFTPAWRLKERIMRIRGQLWRYHSAINRTSARKKQSIFVLLSHHQKRTLIGEITGLYFSWIADKNSKNTSQVQFEAGSPIHLSSYFSLWCIHGIQWMTFLWHFWVLLDSF